MALKEHLGNVVPLPLHPLPLYTWGVNSDQLVNVDAETPFWANDRSSMQCCGECDGLVLVHRDDPVAEGIQGGGAAKEPRPGL